MNPERVLSSPISLPEALPLRSLAELVLGARRAGEDDGATVILGCLGDRLLRVSLRQLRHAVFGIGDELARRGIRAGDTLCLVRLPRTSETLCAVTYAALSVLGVRVFMPMYLEPERFRGWLARVGARAVLWSAAEIAEGQDNELDRALLSRLQHGIRELGVPELCLRRDLDVPALIDATPVVDTPAARERARALIAASRPDDECLVLTTSGTTGQSRMAVYRQEAILRSCQAWEVAGMFDPARQGGRGLCLLFAHSMGVRAFWNAIWTRKPVCLITPEWFVEKPERARALLLHMQPEHVTGGPATYRMLLEFARLFPEIKETSLRGMRCAVSSGAPFDPELARRFELAIGLGPANAFGMTETMQVMTTLVGDSEEHPGGWLGLPLPGVRIGLAHGAGGGGPHRLLVSTPAGCSAFLEEDEKGRPVTRAAPEWLLTGDLVEEKDGGLIFVARESGDFIKDGFGVKVPLARVAGFYRNLGDPIEHVEVFPLSEEPGLAALVFLRGPASNGRGAPASSGFSFVASQELTDLVRSRFMARHEELRATLEDFELRHFTVARFACLDAPPPRTAKGTPDGTAIRSLPVGGPLTGRYVETPGLVRLEPEPLGRASYLRLTSPRRGELMRLARLDKTYLRGRGDRMIHVERGAEVEVIDFVGGFGATLLGHRHPDVVATAAEFLAGERIFLADQGSARDLEGELARRLALLVGRATGRHFIVRFASTGAEAVELVLAHATLEREDRLRTLHRDLRREFGAVCPEQVAAIERRNAAALAAERPKVIAIQGSFHGLTAAARGVLGNAEKRGTYAGLLGVEAIFVPPDPDVDVASLVAAEALPIVTLRRDGDAVVEAPVPFSRIIASIAEPIQGEGGVREVPGPLLARLAACPFPLILDEIQSGLGRSGELLSARDVVGDAYVFSKALGGAVAKVAAVLIDRARYVPRFDEHFASTFGGDAYSCLVAARVLEVIERDDVPGRARERGGAIRRALEAVRADYPEIVKDIRGRGLLLGIELDPSALAGHFLLRAAAQHDDLGILAAAYLLNRHRLRLLPTLSAPSILRVEPSAYIDDEAIGHLAGGLRAFCDAVRRRDCAELCSFLVEEELGFDELDRDGRPLPPTPAPAAMPVALEPPAEGARKVAFLNHFVHPDRELVMVEPSLRSLGSTARRTLLDRLERMLELRPVRTSGQNLLGGRVHLLTVTLAASAATMEELHRSGSRREVVARIQEAVDLARRDGCGAIALGAFTSIVTSDGMGLRPPPGLKIVSGNSFTVVVGAHRVLAACRAGGIRPDDPATRIALLGATGNIGSGLTERLVARGPFRRALLVGRSRPSLERARAILLERRPELEVDVAVRLDALAKANVVVISTSATEPIVFPHHLSPNRTLVVDVAVPGALSAEARALPQVTLAPLSGTVPMPGNPGFIASSHTAPGTTFACMAEVLLCGLESEATRDLRLVGPVDGRAVEVLGAIAVKHGFLERTD